MRRAPLAQKQGCPSSHRATPRGEVPSDRAVPAPGPARRGSPPRPARRAAAGSPGAPAARPPAAAAPAGPQPKRGSHAGAPGRPPRQSCARRPATAPRRATRPRRRPLPGTPPGCTCARARVTAGDDTRSARRAASGPPRAQPWRGSWLRRLCGRRPRAIIAGRHGRRCASVRVHRAGGRHRKVETHTLCLLYDAPQRRCNARAPCRTLARDKKGVCSPLPTLNKPRGGDTAVLS